MILEAFSTVLKREYTHTGDSAKEILHRWLMQFFYSCTPADHINNVIRSELAMVSVEEGNVAFVSRSRSGDRLLDSLYHYCESYERWQFSRWLHHAKPRSFTSLP